MFDPAPRTHPRISGALLWLVAGGRGLRAPEQWSIGCGAGGAVVAIRWTDGGACARLTTRAEGSTTEAVGLDRPEVGGRAAGGEWASRDGSGGRLRALGREVGFGLERLSAVSPTSGGRRGAGGRSRDPGGAGFGPRTASRAAGV